MKTILFIVKTIFLAASFSGGLVWAQSSSIVDLDRSEERRVGKD